MKNLIFLALFMLSLAVFTTSCNKEDDRPEIPTEVNTRAELTEALEKIIEDTEMPGFAINIIKNNVLVYQEGFGYANIQAQIEYDNQTIQNIASISKTFVGAAVVKAIEQGLFDLDTEINELLPVEVINPKLPDAIIRVRHLVSHTSGLLDNAAIYFPTNYHILAGEDLTSPGARIMTTELGVEQRASIGLEGILSEYFLEEGDIYSLDNFAATEPGSTWSYSNFATGLMAYLIEITSGQDFDDYVATYVFNPLNMTDSGYDINAFDPNRLAKAYFNKQTTFPKYANDSYAEGGIYASNEDLGRYLMNMMRGHRGDSQSLFSKLGYAMLFADQLPNGIVPSDFADNHGIFWIKKGNKIQHGGNDLGASTYLEFSDDGQEGYSLLTNMDAVFDFNAYNEVAGQIDQLVQQFLEAN